MEPQTGAKPVFPLEGLGLGKRILTSAVNGGVNILPLVSIVVRPVASSVARSEEDAGSDDSAQRGVVPSRAMVRGSARALDSD